MSSRQPGQFTQVEGGGGLEQQHGQHALAGATEK
jgi:hypothetical protein